MYDSRIDGNGIHEIPHDVRRPSSSGVDRDRSRSGLPGGDGRARRGVEVTDDGDVETVDSLDDALGADHRTVLVLADAATARRACLERFATTSGSPDRLLVLFEEPLERWLDGSNVPDRLTEAVSEPPGRTRVFERSRTGYRRLAEAIPDAVEAAERPAWDAVEHMPGPTFLLAPDGTTERTGVSPETWPGADGATPGSVAFPEQFAGDTIEEGLAAARDGEEWTETLDVGDGPVPSRVSLSPAGEGRVVATVVDVSE